MGVDQKARHTGKKKLVKQSCVGENGIERGRCQRKTGLDRSSARWEAGLQKLVRSSEKEGIEAGARRQEKQQQRRISVVQRGSKKTSREPSRALGASLGGRRRQATD